VQQASQGEIPTLSGSIVSVTPQSCAAAAIAALGPEADVLRCGTWSGVGSPQALAVLKLKSVPSSKGCMPVSRMIILGLDARGWKTVLDGAKEIQNPVGYIGLDFIDDSYQFLGYCLDAEDQRSDGGPGLTFSRCAHVSSYSQRERVPLVPSYTRSGAPGAAVSAGRAEPTDRFWRHCSKTNLLFLPVTRTPGP
jgi:hypothetical protein